jgi:hypothetical protein
MNKLNLREVLLFLCSIPPDSHIRLLLQLALAAEVPEDKLKVLSDKIESGTSLTELLRKENLLVQILEADGEIGAAEENMLCETIEQIGLVVPTNIKGAEYLLEDLSDRLIEELKEK